MLIAEETNSILRCASTLLDVLVDWQHEKYEKTGQTGRRQVRQRNPALGDSLGHLHSRSKLGCALSELEYTVPSRQVPMFGHTTTLVPQHMLAQKSYLV